MFKILLKPIYLIPLILFVGFFMITALFMLIDYTSRSIDPASKVGAIKPLPKPHKLLGFTSTNNKLSSNILEYSRVDENQGSFKVRFNGNEESTYLEIFNQVSIINTSGNISGLDPNQPQRIIEEKPASSIQIDNSDYRLILNSNSDSFFGIYEYNLVDTKTKEEFQEITSYEVETDILKASDIDINSFNERNVITLRVRETNEQDRENKLNGAIQLFSTIQREGSKDFPQLNEVLSPYGDLNFRVTQEFKPEHQAIDLKYETLNEDRSDFYEKYGVVPLFAACNGVASGTIDQTQALLVTLKCESGEIIEYWHNSTNLVYADQPIKTGDLVALEGNSGNSDGAHLHMNYTVNGERKDPQILLDILQKI